MDSLFQDNIFLIFFFASIAIFNYSGLKLFQKLVIIYITIFALVVTGINFVNAMILLFCSTFCFLEVLTEDEMKMKIITGIFHKLVDCIYLSVFQYSILNIIVGCFLYSISVNFSFTVSHIGNIVNYSYIICFIIRCVAILFILFGIKETLSQKYVINTFDEMYSIFLKYPIQNIDFNNKSLKEKMRILCDIEDRYYFERKSYTFLSPKYMMMVLKDKWKSKEKIGCILNSGKNFFKNVFSVKRGYSTIQMQLIRSLGIKNGYNCIYRRKIFEIIYSKLFFAGIRKYYESDYVNGRNHYKEYLLIIYFLQVNTFLTSSNNPGEYIMIDHFIDAFKGDDKNKVRKLITISNEAVFIACIGLSQRIYLLNEANIKLYTSELLVDLDDSLVLRLLKEMKTNINDQKTDGFIGLSNETTEKNTI